MQRKNKLVAVPRAHLIEGLEHRVLLSAVVQSAAGANVAAITPTRDAFRTTLGGGAVAGANGSFGGLRREINWDGVPAVFAAPNALPANFFNVNSPRGVVFSSPDLGATFQVSSDPADAATAGQPAAANFGNIDPTYSTAFGVFSPNRLFTPVGSNVTDVTFFLPGTTTPSATNGFGAVFTDVDSANTTSIEYFDGNDVSLGKFFAPVAAGNAGFSFLGVSFDNAEQVARVRITTGAAAVAAPDVTQNGSNPDVVVMDDFIYGEPGEFTVVNTNDAGTGSLRQALTNANAVAGKHPIDFNIAGAGVHTIVLASDLPTSTGPVAIDGYTQPGSSPNTMAVGGNAVLNVEVDASGFRLFRLLGGNSLVRGLVLNDFHDAAIGVVSSNNVIAGNYIGTDPTGTLSRAVQTGGTAPIGVNLDTGTNTTIGGTSPADRNVLSANFNGIASFNSGIVSGTQILNNYVGTDRSGTLPLGNANGGVNLLNQNKGGYTVVGNVISANGVFGISVNTGAGSNHFTANMIGTAADGVSPLGNMGTGISIANDANEQIGGLNPGDGNTIAFNTARGVAVGPPGDNTSTGSAILSNRIFGNGGLGIDLNTDGVTPNDPSDADTGANRRQNFPVIVSALNDGSTTTINGILNSTPSTPFVIQFFSDSAGASQGQTLLGNLAVITDGAGNAPLAFVCPFNVAPGDVVTATATTLTAAPFGDTSEFSPAVSVAAPPPTVSVNDVSTIEGNSGTHGVTFTLTLSAAATSNVVVSFSTPGDTATKDVDYVYKTGTVTFTPGQTSKTVTVQVKGDTTVESNEKFKLKINSVTGPATIGDGTGFATIVNDDSSKPKISIAGVSLLEGNSGNKAFQFKIVLDKASSSPVTVKYATSNGSATAGSDYNALSLTTLTFAANQTTKFVTVFVKGDTVHEGDETFFLNLSSATNATISVSKGTGTIRNDD